jgi:cold shock CspA family protein
LQKKTKTYEDGVVSMARTVIYGQNEPFTIENDNLSLNQIRDTMAEFFPELKNAAPRQEGDKVYFDVKAGTKGMARTVIYGQNEPFTIENDSLSLNQIRDTMAEFFPELKNATPRQEGDKVYFDVKAGTKGARTVIYGQNEPFTIENDSLSLNQIRDTMAEFFPELKNATPRQEGDKVYFDVKAGTKGSSVKGVVVRDGFIVATIIG